jgi:hypothetical protein
MERSTQHRSERFGIDPESLASYRAELRLMAAGSPIAEAAIEGYNDWQVVEAMERLWAVGTADLPEGDTVQRGCGSSRCPG